MKISVSNYQKLLLAGEDVRRLNHSKLTHEGFMFCVKHTALCWNTFHVAPTLTLRKDAVTEHTELLPTGPQMPSFSNQLHLRKGWPTRHTESRPPDTC